MRRSAAIVWALTLAVAGCESAVSEDNTGDDARLTQQDWVAQSIAGKPVVQIGRVILSFGEGRVSGRGGCNLYSGSVEYGKGAIKIGPLISTKMACVEDGLMQQESAYLKTLQGAQRYSIGGDGMLTIATNDGAIVYEGAPRQVRPEN